MSNGNPACMSCYLNNPWLNEYKPQYLYNPAWPPIFGPTMPVFDNTTTLTAQEKDILYYLGQAWAAFNQLEIQHPNDKEDFLRAIHAAQEKIALRVARRVDSAIWFSDKNP